MRRPLAWLLALLLLLPVAEAASPPSATSTEAFLRQAVAAVRFGAASSQLALKKTKNDHVLGVAHQMASDYAVASMRLRQIVADGKFATPREPLDAAHKALFDALNQSPPGKPFAKAYLDAQAKALPPDIEAFKLYAEKGDDERLKLFAQDMVPVMRGHLEQLDKLERFRK